LTDYGACRKRKEKQYEKDFGLQSRDGTKKLPVPPHKGRATPTAKTGKKGESITSSVDREAARLSDSGRMKKRKQTKSKRGGVRGAAPSKPPSALHKGKRGRGWSSIQKKKRMRGGEKASILLLGGSLSLIGEREKRMRTSHAGKKKVLENKKSNCRVSIAGREKVLAHGTREEERKANLSKGEI